MNNFRKTLNLLEGRTILEMRSNEELAGLLAPNHPNIGPEKVTNLGNDVQHRVNQFGSHRFFKTDRYGTPIAVLQVVSTEKGKGHATNVYVHPDHRQKGIGTELHRIAKKKFKNLTISDDRSELGQYLANKVERKSS